MTAISIAKKVAFSPNYLKQTDTQTLLGEIINKETRTFNIEFEFAYKNNKLFDIYRYVLTLTLNKNNLYEINHEKMEVITNYTKNKKYVRIKSGTGQGKVREELHSYISRNSVPEYRYINYDLELVKEEYEKVTLAIMEMQMALDKYNQIEQFDVDI